MTFTYRALDDEGAPSNIATVTITVTGVNDAPTVTTPVPDVTVDQDSPDTVFSLYPYFQDAEDDDSELGYTVVGNTNPSLFTIVDFTDPTQFRLDYAPGAIGIADITIRATDMDGLYVDDTFTVTLTMAANDPPTITEPIPDVMVGEDAPNTTFSLYPYFEDLQNTDAQLTYTVVNNTNPGLFTSVNISDPTNFTLDYAPDANGTAEITIRATDTGFLWVEDTFTVTVNPVNDTPALSAAIPDVTVDEDAANTAFSLYSYFQDVEDTDAQLTYTVVNNTNPSLFTSVNISNPTNFTLDYAPDANGTAEITVRATDTGLLLVEDTFSVTVNPVNDVAGAYPDGSVTRDDYRGFVPDVQRVGFCRSDKRCGYRSGAGNSHLRSGWQWGLGVQHRIGVAGRWGRFL